MPAFQGLSCWPERAPRSLDSVLRREKFIHTDTHAQMHACTQEPRELVDSCLWLSFTTGGRTILSRHDSRIGGKAEEPIMTVIKIKCVA